ncbi:fibronectin type III domain-containing protein [Treponema sp.]|uniref:fibronectin type III domain-containing protein n=1 Tax=Treponema sp. TaxID=166 RepID=UPI0025E1EEAC|nr:fibronectin type III domain-containing protein [Treponema sp.]MCR5218532.1 fibronectin type III domain-containing protein [Treponema sp.]
MLKTLKVISAAILTAAMIFTSCDTEGGFDYVDTNSNSSPEYSVEGLSTSSSETYDFVLDKTNIMPGDEEGTFTVFVKNSKPVKLIAKNSASGVSISAGKFTATTSSDSVGEGAWKAVVSYAVDSSITEAVDGACKFYVMFSDSDVETVILDVNVKASYMPESETYKLVDATESASSEHSFTLTWTYQSGIEATSVTYEIYKVTSSGDEYVYTEVETGSLAAGAVTLTPTSTLDGKSNYCVKIKAVGADGWYETTVGTSDGWVTTTNDITPPVAPAVVVASTGEDSVTLTYTKGNSTDDTTNLTIAVTTTADGITVPAMASAVTATYGETALTYDVTDGLDVSSVAAEGTVTVVIGSLQRAETAVEYSITVTAYDACDNHTSATPLTASTVADTTAPVVDADGVSVSAGLSSAKITWANPADNDFAGITLKKGDEVVETGLTGGVYALTGLTEGATYTLYATDTLGHVQTTGTDVVVTLDTFEASAVVNYTGSVLVTWNDVVDYEADGSKISYTYDVSCTNGVSSITGVEEGTKSAHFKGLEVGSEYTFTASVMNGSTTVVSSTPDAVTAKTVILKIGNGYSANGTTPSRYLAWVSSKSSTTCYNTGAVADSANPTASYWIIRPALSGTDGYFSLEAATGTTGVGTGYFLYADTNSRSYVDYNGTWGSGDWSNFAMVATTTGVENDGTSYITDTKQASFYWGESSWNSSFSRLYSESMSGYYVCHASLTFGLTNSSSEDNAGCAAFIIASTATANSDYYNDVAPAAVTNLTAGTAKSTKIPLTWTNPSDLDLSFVRISYTTGSTTKTLDVAAGTVSATLSGLTKGTSYSITATAYDVYGNASDATEAITVETSNPTNIPMNVAATARFTGEILVTWDRASDDTSSNWQYKVECSDANVTAKSFISLTSYAGTYADEADGVAQFTGLTSSTEYTFTVYASEDGETWNAAEETVSATAATMTHKIRNTFAQANHGSDHSPLNTAGAANKLMCQWSTGGGTATWNIYPALDGTITVTHDVTNSSSETVSKVYDTFSIYHTSKGYVTLASSAMTETAATSLGTNVSLSTSTSSDATGASTFFFGYNSTESAYTLRANVASKNFALGYSGTNNNDTEILYFNDATSATCESNKYAWYFD